MAKTSSSILSARDRICFSSRCFLLLVEGEDRSGSSKLLYDGTGDVMDDALFMLADDGDANLDDGDFVDGGEHVRLLQRLHNVVRKAVLSRSCAHECTTSCEGVTQSMYQLRSIPSGVTHVVARRLSNATLEEGARGLKRTSALTRSWMSEHRSSIFATSAVR